MTIDATAAAIGGDLLDMIDAIVTHRINVITDGDWFVELVTRIVNEAKETN